MKKIETTMESMPIENLYGNVKQVIESARETAYRAVNFAMVQSYWQIGKLIVEEEQNGKERAGYGDALLKHLAKKLGMDYGKGYTVSNLQYMRQFYITFQIYHALRGELSWTHYRSLLKVEREDARMFYMNEAVNCNWNTRTLERQINSSYFERLVMTPEQSRPLLKEEAETQKVELEAKDFIKDPYVLEFLDLKANPGFYERELEQSIIDKLQEFLLELGKGFCFVARQYRISLEDEHFYADLVFYNYILKCFLIVDLKRGKLTHQDIGQMDTYVRYFEDQVRQENDNPTIGLILCAEKNKALAKYSLLNDNKHVFASRYKTYLPSEEELQREITREISQAELEAGLKK
ncbi:PDDEXK nuclease domain-containing protein [Pedobacter sp.]|jgi:predicted nuclease of restriction endonuclease-like (RecB) superfamily|uniref:PDDEXK nuclease domain-containing protein n=1 Tax=Pedobacter sp. TaxID=1411316 RepID=UPI002C10D6EB|nr:PDDEXK nuclease domain-containing protein [Pedobacter sp.]HWW38422.1 PDDEXK nuclease domain-containing protein [Pedobacter sp.]